MASGINNKAINFLIKNAIGPLAKMLFKKFNIMW